MLICITGIAGFIGSHLGERLISLGHEVIGIDNFDSFYPKSIKLKNLENISKESNFQFIEMDIRDAPAIDTLFMNHSFDIVIHLAAKAGVRPSMENAAVYFNTNVTGTLVLLESMRKSRIRRMIFASSSSVYGNNAKVPFAESDFVDHPISPYAATKKSGELLCHVYSHLYNFDINCLRFFTVYGPRQRPDLAIHKFTRLIDTDTPIPVFGDGSTARDYTFIEDIIDGIICSMNHLNGFEIYNLGESKTVTLNQLIEILERKTGKKAIRENLSEQPGDVNTTFADISKARARLGYYPKYDIEFGIDKFLNWYYKYKNLHQ